MTTHILVDFENVQPSAADIALVRDESLRLAIFRGPGQMKYSADLAEAWQPLGARVTFVRCAKAGRNAVDMHIAFHLGQLVAAHQGSAAAQRARFVIVSKDTDFDPLLMHIRAQGFDASRVGSIKAALGGRGAEPQAEKPRAARAAPAARAAKQETRAPAAKKTATKKAAKKSSLTSAPETARKTPSAAQETRKARTAPPATRKPATAPAPAAKPAKPAAGGSDEIAKVLDSLRRMGERRPAKRAGLERHIESHLGRELSPEVIQGLMHQLERDGVLTFSENKVTYRLPKARQ